MEEDTSKGNGSRAARYEYSLSDNVTWVQPPCFFFSFFFFWRAGEGLMAARFQRTSSIVVASSSIMSIDEIFFPPLFRRRGIRSFETKKEIGRCLYVELMYEIRKVVFFFLREREGLER